jgi:hypothetical protein
MIFVAATRPSLSLPRLILRIRRKIESLAPCESGSPDRASTRIANIQDNALESHTVVWRRRGIQSQRAESTNGALPDLLAPRFRFHLSKGPLGPGRAGFSAGFLCYAA